MQTILKFLISGLLLCTGPVFADPAAPAVAAAADLQFVLPQVARHFSAETGLEVRLTFGSSGNFAQQIEQGAPFEMYLSADERYVARLHELGLTKDAGALYGQGRIVLFAPHGSRLVVKSGIGDLRAAVGDGRLRRLALANPDHAPYGRAGRAALQNQGLWDLLVPRLVLGENAAQAAQFATSGAQGGIIPLSLALSSELSSRGRYFVIPADWHAEEPLLQRMVLLEQAGSTAQAFYDYMQQPAARQLLKQYGFELPGQGAD